MDIARLNARSKLSNKQRDFTDNELGRQSHIRNVHLRFKFLFEKEVSKFRKTKRPITLAYSTPAAETVTDTIEPSDNVKFALSAKVIIKISERVFRFIVCLFSIFCLSLIFCLSSCPCLYLVPFLFLYSYFSFLFCPFLFSYLSSPSCLSLGSFLHEVYPLLQIFTVLASTVGSTFLCKMSPSIERIPSSFLWVYLLCQHRQVGH